MTARKLLLMLTVLSETQAIPSMKYNISSNSLCPSIGWDPNSLELDGFNYPRKSRVVLDDSIRMYRRTCRFKNEYQSPHKITTLFGAKIYSAPDEFLSNLMKSDFEEGCSSLLKLDSYPDEIRDGCYFHHKRDRLRWIQGKKKEVIIESDRNIYFSDAGFLVLFFRLVDENGTCLHLRAQQYVMISKNNGEEHRMPCTIPESKNFTLCAKIVCRNQLKVFASINIFPDIGYENMTLRKFHTKDYSDVFKGFANQQIVWTIQFGLTCILFITPVCILRKWRKRASSIQTSGSIRCTETQTEGHDDGESQSEADSPYASYTNISVFHQGLQNPPPSYEMVQMAENLLSLPSYKQALAKIKEESVQSVENYDMKLPIGVMHNVM